MARGKEHRQGRWTFVFLHSPRGGDSKMRLSPCGSDERGHPPLEKMW